MATFLATAALRVQTGPFSGRSYEVLTSLRLGRHPYNEASLPDLSLSRYHCWIQGTDTGYFIEDLASTNGTYVNGRRIQSRQLLQPGDVIRVGASEIVFAEGD